MGNTEEATQPFSALQGNVQDATSKVLELVLNGKQYSTSNVQEWTDAISTQTVEALREISGHFKFTATCVLTQKTGGGLHVGSAACWEQAIDGHVVERWENETILAIVIVFGCSL
eukprot:jgi/Undpi1/758/HiC_scaffold_10.g04222.m1